MLRTVSYILFGYLSGSILFGQIWSKILHTHSITTDSKDHNPGVANAFTFGGFKCGMLTLICELAKGIIPIALYIATCKHLPFDDLGFALILSAPVIGHNFSIFNGFSGGKGIAVTFGCLLGLLPVCSPVLIMAVCFVFFSLVIRVSPHFYRTAVSYIAALPLMALYSFKMNTPSICIGFAIITLAVGYKLFKSPEEKEKVKVSMLWMH